MNHWTQQEAVLLCKAIEKIAPKFGCHVALTGGTLYGEGTRKDCDILFYRIRQTPEIDGDGLFEALDLNLGIHKVKGFGWCVKCETREGKKIDCFFPEELEGEHISGE